MSTLLIYDSFFGNTKKIAEAIVKGFGEGNCKSVRVDDFKSDNLNDIKLLIVGSPTRAFMPSPKIKKFISLLAKNKINGINIAAFDTRADMSKVNNKILKVMVKLFGYGAEPIEKKLVKKGGISVVAPEGFYVNDTEGPLGDGEIERAVNWGKRIANLL